MKDYLVRGLVNSKNCRVFACQTTNLLEKACKMVAPILDELAKEYDE